MRKLLEELSAILSEATMGYLALVALGLAFTPFVFGFTREEYVLLHVAEWTIVGVFALEYLVDLALAPSKLGYVLSWWRVIDIFIIVGPFLVFLYPAQSLRASPALRLLRFGRIIVFGARIGSRVAAVAEDPHPVEAAGAEEIRLVRPGSPAKAATLEELREGLRHPQAEWFHAASLGGEHLAEVAQALGVSAAFLAETLGETEYPRIEAFERHTAIFTWIPSVHGDEPVRRNGFLLLASSQLVLSLSQHPCDLAPRLEHEHARVPQTAPFATRVTLGLLEEVLHRYEKVAGHFEKKLRALELVPVRESRPEFLEQTFRIQRQLAFLKSDLWRLKGLLAAIGEGRLRFPGVSGDALEFVRVLADEAGYVYETVFNVREGLLSLIDLHLNVVSFEMNKVMRILAVMSALGLVPAVVGGIFGMNLVGNPWPVTLAQVSFGIAAAMATLVYLFIVKGWLR